MKSFKVKRSWFDRKRELTLYPTHFELENCDLRNATLTRVEVSDIIEFRYGVEWITGYMFTFGRVYVLDIKTVHDGIIKIRFGSLYKIGLEAQSQAYRELINAMYDHYFDAMSRSFIEKHNAGEEFELAGITFRATGVILSSGHFIEWENLGTSSHFTYYALYSKLDDSIADLNYYLTDWNAGILYSVSRAILISKGLHVEDPIDEESGALA